MLNFDDRDLVELAEGAGFGRVSLTLEVETRPPERTRWQAYVNTAWNPRVPTLRDAIRQVLTPEEQARYEAHMQLLVEAGRGSQRTAAAYLRAVKDQTGS
jgi:arsenite methyltransferase